MTQGTFSLTQGDGSLESFFLRKMTQKNRPPESPLGNFSVASGVTFV